MGAVRRLDHDPSGAFDVPRVAVPYDPPDGGLVLRTREHAARAPLRLVRLQQIPEDRVVAPRIAQSAEGPAVGLIEGVLLRGKDDLPRIELAPCDLLHRATCGALPRSGFRVGEHLRSLLAHLREHTLPLEVRLLEDQVGLRLPALEDRLDDAFQGHARLVRVSPTAGRAAGTR